VEAADPRTLALVTAFTPTDRAPAPGALDLFSALCGLRVSPSHPLMAFLDSLLGGSGLALNKAKVGDRSAVSFADCLAGFQSRLLTRRGLTAEELFGEGASAHLGDAETSAHALQRAVGALREPRSVVDPAHALGPVGAVALTHAHAAPAGGVVGGDGVRLEVDGRGKDGRGVVSMAAQEAQTKGPLHQYLLQHHLQRALWAHSQAVAYVSAQAVRQLRSLLGSTVRPVLVAAKDAPLLRETTAEEAQRGGVRPWGLVSTRW
jgi:hypothetical protein